MNGQIIGGHYQIVKLLGKGGFGETYLAQDIHLPDRPYHVVKRLKPQFSDPSMLQHAKRLFDTEVQVLYKLGQHDQIPRLLAHFSENQDFYLVQELVIGHNLSIEFNPPELDLLINVKLTESTVIKLLYDILEILAFVHQQGVIHRDLKPSNLMRRYSDGKIVLIDFGAVKQVKGQIAINNQGQITPTIAIGTPGYTPSEQAHGQPQLSSDIYAVGIIGIQALTGILPQNLPTDNNSLEVIWQDRVNVSQNLATVLNKMIKYHHKDRYQSAQEALQAMRNLLTDFQPVKIVNNRLKLGWLLIGMLIFVNIIMAIALAYQLTRTQSITPEPQPTSTTIW